MRGSWMRLGLTVLAGVLMGGLLPAMGAESANAVRIVETKGTVEVIPAGAIPPDWTPVATNAPLHANWRLRTGTNSSVTLQLPDGGVLRYPENTETEILPVKPGGRSVLRLLKGILSFFHKDEPRRLEVLTRGSHAISDGTEFVMEVQEVNGVERVTFYVIDGQVTVTNVFGLLPVTNGQSAIVEEGQKPVRSAGFITNNILQWAFYYPAVLDLRDLPLGEAEVQALTNSLASYRQGDLLAALANYPAGRLPASDAERVYRAALLLSVGSVPQAEAALDALPAAEPTATLSRLAGALRQLIAAVKRQPRPALPEPVLASEFLAASYYEQSRAVRESSLRAALALARRAATNSPGFSFAWARVAELEFGFGHTGAANDALKRSLDLADRNAQAIALSGFVAAARNRIFEAREWFDRAIAVDPALANAWLGRGLVSIRRGDDAAGRADLLVAAALEPQRSLLRSYLGKALANSGDLPRARHEMDLAKQLDPADPTPWLYSALLNEQANRINEGIRYLERSVELNDNRRLFRSQGRVDQDRAVRQANLARLYADVNMGDVAVREAGRAVASDYANYSAHLFLANSYEHQRRENFSNLRFEAPAFGEYLIANLLGPASGVLLAQSVTQLEYSRLLERDGLGVNASTEYFSRGAWRHSSSQHGTFGASSYSLEAEYWSEPGQRLNQDLEFRQLEAKFKHDLTPRDSILLHVIDFHGAGGDVAQRFSATSISPLFRFKEKQTPTVFAGYHHEWSPENHTLLLGGRVDDTLNTEDPASSVLALDRTFGTLNGLVPVQVRHGYQSRVKVYSAEAQQIAVLGRQTLIAGAGLQWSDQRVGDRVSDPNGPFVPVLGTNNPISVQNIRATAFGVSIYGYDYLKLADSLRAVGGVNYTRLDLPVNTVSAPETSARQHQDQVSPKAGLIWSPVPWMDLRGSYTRSLSGFGLGQSLRLEPTQVAGLAQTFRGAVPPALVGDLEGVNLETAEVVWEGRLPDTFLSVGWQRLAANKPRRVGLFLSHPVDYDFGPSPGLLRERLDFTENSLDVSAHRLLGQEWSFGIRYRLACAQLKRSYPQYDEALFLGGLDGRNRSQAWLHTLELSALYRHPSGFFARADGNWYSQNRRSDGSDLAGDTFWQVNVLAGYRFPKLHGEVALGILNATGHDYQLDPLNTHPDLPRTRTFYARILLSF